MPIRLHGCNMKHLKSIFQRDAIKIFKNEREIQLQLLNSLHEVEFKNLPIIPPLLVQLALQKGRLYSAGCRRIGRLQRRKGMGAGRLLFYFIFCSVLSMMNYFQHWLELKSVLCLHKFITHGFAYLQRSNIETTSRHSQSGSR